MTFEAARVASALDVARLTELAALAAAELSDQRGGAIWAVREARQAPLADAFRRLLADDDALVVLGTFDDVVLGFAVAELELLRDGTRLGLLREIYVEPPARGVGVGEALMDEVLAWCRAKRCRGVDSLVLPGSRESKNFFERFGLTARAILVHRSLVDDEGDGAAS